MTDINTEASLEVTSPVEEAGEMVEDTANEAEELDQSTDDESFDEWLARQKDEEDAEGDKSSPESDVAEEAEEDVPEEPKEPETKVWKLKVNGKEIEFDASNEQEVQRQVQMGLASQQKFQEAKQIKAQAESFITALKNNPRAVLEHPSIGINLREFAEEYLYEQLQAEADPEAHQRQQEKQELERYRQERAEMERQRQEQERQQIINQHREQFQTQIVSALQDYQLPANDWTVSRMAGYMKQAIANGYKHVTPADVAQMVKQDWVTAQQQMIQQVSDDQLIEMLGKDTADRIRRANLAKQGIKSPTKAPPASAKPKAQQPQKRFTSVDQLLDALR